MKSIAQLLAHKPAVVTVMYGTNDSYVDPGKDAARLTVEEYRANLARLVDERLDPLLIRGHSLERPQRDAAAAAREQQHRGGGAVGGHPPVADAFGAARGHLHQAVLGWI